MKLEDLKKGEPFKYIEKVGTINLEKYGIFLGFTHTLLKILPDDVTMVNCSFNKLHPEIQKALKASSNSVGTAGFNAVVDGFVRNLPYDLLVKQIRIYEIDEVQ